MNEDLVLLSDSEDDENDEVTQEERKRQEEIKAELEKQDVSSVHTKILFNYFQIVAVLGTFEFNWPNALIHYQNANTQVVSATQSFFSFDCLLQNSVFKDMGMKVFFVKLLFFSISPIIFVVFCFIVWKILFVFKFKKDSEERRK